MYTSKGKDDIFIFKIMNIYGQFNIITIIVKAFCLG